MSRFLAKYLKQERKRLSVSPAELAKRWGRSEATVLELEGGVRRLNRHEVPSLARALDRSTAEVSYAAGFLADEASEVFYGFPFADGVVRFS